MHSASETPSSEPRRAGAPCASPGGEASNRRFAYRIDVLLGLYRDFALPGTGAAWSRYEGWYQAMCETEIFRATATDHPNYRERLIAFYLPYSQGKGQQDVKQAP